MITTAPPHARSAASRLDALATRFAHRAGALYAAADRGRTVGDARQAESLGDAYQEAADDREEDIDDWAALRPAAGR